MALLINVEVFGRYLFNYSTHISDEYSGYFFSWMTLLCFLYGLRTGRFLRVDALLLRLPRRGREVLAIPASLVGVGVSAILARATFTLWHVNWMFNSVSLQPSQTPLWIPMAVMPVGFALLALGYLERFATAVLRLTGRMPADRGVDL